MNAEKGNPEMMKLETRNSTGQGRCHREARHRTGKGGTLFLLLLFPLFANAGPGYKLVCDKPIYDFGRVGQSAVITNVFTIRNEGYVAFPLKYVHTSCGCTRGRMDKRIIEPGQTARVTAVYKAARRKGAQKKALRLLSTSSEYPALTLYMQGFVETP